MQAGPQTSGRRRAHTRPAHRPLRRAGEPNTDMALAPGILLALACAVVANLAFFLKYRGANAVAQVSPRHPLRSARQLFSSKWFTLGMILATASWGLHVAALAIAPMSVVQVALAAGVVLIAVMADRIFGFRVGRRQWLGLI